MQMRPGRENGIESAALVWVALDWELCETVSSRDSKVAAAGASRQPGERQRQLAVSRAPLWLPRSVPRRAITDERQSFIPFRLARRLAGRSAGRRDVLGARDLAEWNLERAAHLLRPALTLAAL